MGPKGGRRLGQPEQTVPKAAQRRQRRLAQLIQTVLMLVLVRSELTALLIESPRGAMLSKVPQESRLLHLPRQLVRSTQLTQQLQSALRHHQRS